MIEINIAKQSSSYVLNESFAKITKHIILFINVIFFQQLLVSDDVENATGLLFIQLWH